MVFIQPGNADEYNKAFDQSNLLVVYYMGKWCSSCKAIEPVFERIANENQDITFIKVDVEALSSIPEIKNTMGVPKFKFYQNKKSIYEFVGAYEGSIKMGIEKLRN